MRTRYLGDLRTEITHLDSGAKIITDAPKDNNGKGESFSPTDLIASALGSCMLTIMGIACETHNFDIVGTRLEIEKLMDSDPRKVKEIIIDFYFPANKTYTDKQKKIIDHIINTCPVRLSIHPDIIKNIRCHY